jgi:hypothetical protein
VRELSADRDVDCLQSPERQQRRLIVKKRRGMHEDVLPHPQMPDDGEILAQPLDAGEELVSPPRADGSVVLARPVVREQAVGLDFRIPSTR